LVTGASRGIGRAIALRLAADGFDLAVNFRRDETAAAAVVEAARELGRRAHAYRASVADAQADAEMIEAVVEDLGGLDVLINNAGVASRGRAVTDTDPSEVESLLATHAIGAHHLCRLAIPLMRPRGGSVVMVSSIATKAPVPNGAPYNMGKSALEALARTLAIEELANRIRVNVVAPGLVDTEMGRRLVGVTRGVKDMRDLDESSPQGRVCRPEDVAGVVSFLAGDDSSYVSGQVIYVDGGA
jgi:NAD(P)-dependent dehydrogenase (short-subunit alcohol dehydrogenase family)